MKTEKNILIAFLLNIAFSIFEIIGGFLTNSVAITSDAIHDFGDALSIGISLILERISKKSPDNKYTYGYARYSILGALITSSILIAGSIIVIYSAITRLFNPANLNYNGMIIFAIIGVIINFIAAYLTKEGESLNQKAVNLHMLEDVLNWLIVLIGSIILKFTEINYIDSIMSLIVATFILVNAFKNIKKIIDLFLEKTPTTINIPEFKKHLLTIPNVKDIHHIHIWSLDGVNNFATMHIVTTAKNSTELKSQIKQETKKYHIVHTTIEIEFPNEHCHEQECSPFTSTHNHHHHHHH